MRGNAGEDAGGAGDWMAFFIAKKPPRLVYHERHELHEKFKEVYSAYLSCIAGWPWAVACPGLPQIRTCTH
jgi:hypothetical protein